MERKGTDTQGHAARPARQVRRWVARVAGRSLWLVVLLCVLQGASAVLAVLLALVMRDAIDAAVAGNAAQFYLEAALFAGTIAAQIVLRAAFRAVNERSRAGIDNRLRGRALSAVLNEPLSAVQHRHSGELMSRMTSDVQVVSDGICSIAPNLVSMAVRIVGVLGVMVAIAPQLAAILLVAGAAMVAASAALRGVLRRCHARMQEAESAMRCFLQEAIESLLVVHAYGIEGKVQRRNAHNMQEHRRARLRKNAVANAGNVGMNVAVQGGYVIGFIWCCVGILDGTVSYGTLVAVIQLIGQVQGPFTSLGGLFPKYASLLASAERLMDLECDAQQPAHPAPAGGLSAEDLYAHMASLAFSHVSFAYDDGRTVLRDVSLSVPRGAFVAIVGPSGVGKSTLMKLLLAVYRPQTGRVCLVAGAVAGGIPSVSKPPLGEASVSPVGGVPALPREVDVSTLPAGLFAYVPQGNFLMSGTIEEVVGFAERGDAVDPTRVRAACCAACADDFITQLPQGYETLLGERGAGLSEGQMQRLAVARALYSGAPILLLDECTSALDAETERQLLANMRDLQGRTVLIVTHRAQALSLCDMTVEVQADGSVRATRTASQLPEGGRA